MSASKSPDCRDTADALLEYLHTKNPKVISKIPVGNSSQMGALAEAGSPATLAVNECLGHPDSDAVLEVVAFLISYRRYHDALVHPRFSGGFGNALAFAGPRKETGSAAQAALIAAARRVGVDHEEIARYALLEHGHQFDFGWSLRVDSKFVSIVDPRSLDRVFQAGFEPASVFERMVWELPDEALRRLALAEQPSPWGRGTIHAPATLIGALAATKPHLLDEWSGKQSFDLQSWKLVLASTRRFDEVAGKIAAAMAPGPRLEFLMVLSLWLPGIYTEPTREAAVDAKGDDLARALLFLADQFPGDLMAKMERVVVTDGLPEGIVRPVYEKIFAVLVENWNHGGKAVFETIVTSPYRPLGERYSSDRRSLYSYGISSLLSPSSPVPEVEIKDWTRKALEGIANAKVEKKELSLLTETFWTAAVARGSKPLREELLVLLGDKLKTLRQLAVQGLLDQEDPGIADKAVEMLFNGKVDQRLGAIMYLSVAGHDAAAASFLKSLDSEKSENIRTALHEGLLELKKRGIVFDEPFQNQGVLGEVPFAELEAAVIREASKLKLPSANWLKLELLPGLHVSGGAGLSVEAIAYLIAKQAKHKEIAAAPDIQPLLAHIDRGLSAPFAIALVEGFLKSEQAASDRWALALGGLLGDNRIIPPLLSRIPDWCENSRHKLAEYAAQAISLLPGNEPLMVLDTLANRYRSKFKNVGKACAEAFNAAAEARGITPDELGDLVVPDFGFDAEGIRRFEWNGGGANAELGADFKISWFDPVSGKAWKALPASATEEIKTEVKTLGKLLRETVKAQALRLEMSLVRQRRWTVSRWRELYENHPVLRSFACGLVWGLYDSSGALLRSFRRYSNGILADASGNIEELAETDAVIGMIHPLELGAADLDAWKAHLTRLKVKPPFPQLDRPVEWMDPLHGNRRRISITEGRKVGAGTFKSRSEKRGWLRGSVVDAGGISSVYKSFPGAGIEVVLMTHNYWIGIDPMDQVELGDACFVKADSISRGSYTYDEPASDDPRVLRFDQVPAVVYSETIGDLKAIIGDNKSA